MRNQFPIFRSHPELIYLDSAATTHKPDCVIDAMTHFMQKDYATVHRAAYRSSLYATEQYHAARDTARSFLNAANAEEIVFTRGTTDSINLVARTFPFEQGDEVILSALEHHSNLVPWQMLAQERGIILKWIPLHPDGSLSLDLPISKRTKLITVTHCSNVTGSITPLAPIVAAARSVNAAVLVDGAQAAPHFPIDVQALDVDFYACSGHKCYGPTGIGILYGKKERLAIMRPLQGGGDMVQRVELETSEYQEPPLRFEAGTPNIIGAIGLKAAFEFLRNGIHPDLLPEALSLLSQIEGLRILGCPQAPIVTFTLEGVHPLDLATLLDSRSIAIRTGTLCAQPLIRFFGCETVARASLGIYTTKEDLLVFAESVEHVANTLRKTHC